MATMSIKLQPGRNLMYTNSFGASDPMLAVRVSNSCWDPISSREIHFSTWDSNFPGINIPRL